MMPGMPERRTHDYVRHGTTTLFAAINVADGKVISSLHRRHRAIEFKKVLDQDRPPGPRPPPGAPDLRQLRHPEAPDHQDLAPSPPAGNASLHPDLLIVVEPRRAVLRLRHRRPAPTLRPPQRPSPRSRHPQVGHHMERGPQGLRMDQNRRTDPRQPRTTYPTDWKSRTLVGERALRLRHVCGAASGSLRRHQDPQSTSGATSTAVWSRRT